nr:MAG TPA: hypothetical protein [Bacteriophage sp.]
MGRFFHPRLCQIRKNLETCVPADSVSLFFVLAFLNKRHCGCKIHFSEFARKFGFVAECVKHTFNKRIRNIRMVFQQCALKQCGKPKNSGSTVFNAKVILGVRNFASAGGELKRVIPAFKGEGQSFGKISLVFHVVLPLISRN